MSHIEDGTEVYVFSGIQYFLLLVRFLFILYFIYHAVRYVKSKERATQKKDGFTFATWILIITSSTMFLISGTFIITL
jgi:hypothetical protein